MIQLNQVTYQYPQHQPVFQGFDWRVQRGEAWAVLGPSGCGKSTLLYLLAGLRFPQSGQVIIGGEFLSKPRPNTGLILQDYGLLPWATVSENASLGLRLRLFYGPDGRHAPAGQQVQDAEAQANHWLDRLGLTEVKDKYPGQISGGQRQRTAIARTLATDPDLLLMDEPFASLDAPTRQSLGRLVRSLRQEAGLTTIIVTHAIEEAARLGERILVLNQPPNRSPQIVENPGAAVEGYSESAQYLSLCTRLRGLLEPAQ
ncbi:MAG: ATP-binding cassette domain-containing protein [Anaerolineales bacterium]|nr:ATP-binding cassette domain-containing protein [Anaerolineales bacterium]